MNRRSSFPFFLFFFFDLTLSAESGVARFHAAQLHQRVNCKVEGALKSKALRSVSFKPDVVY